MCEEDQPYVSPLAERLNHPPYSFICFIKIILTDHFSHHELQHPVLTTMFSHRLKMLFITHFNEICTTHIIELNGTTECVSLAWLSCQLNDKTERSKHTF